jgi:hypothetical protein
LDVKGLLAAWREGLLAKKVLEGKTRGYRNHPQLIRFVASGSPLVGINKYLHGIYMESLARGYAFDGCKIDQALIGDRLSIPVTRGQVQYEVALLKHKLSMRDQNKYAFLMGVSEIRIGAAFHLVEGEIESWEKTIQGL